MVINKRSWLAAMTCLSLFALPIASEAQTPTLTEARIAELLDQVEAEVTERARLAQVIVDKVFSFSELGMQEVETSRYLVSLLRDNGFEVQEGVVGVPTSWWATWTNGTGGPTISFGSDIDGIPKANQKPGVAYHDPLVADAPGHGEGHNSGQSVNIVAAIALQEVMRRENIPGTIALWPGVAEEQLGSKAWLVREGYFDDVDAVIFTHVGSNLGVSWGASSGTGMVSVEFTFSGESAHSAGSPWRGRSALDAVELMNVGWNYHREHMNPLQRSHYIITDGGDQPNVVPSQATVWYFIREIEFDGITANFEALKRIAEGAALMTNTTVTHRVLGQAAPRNFSRPIAELVGKHIEAVGLPEWSDNDIAFAKAIQLEVGSRPSGLPTEVSGVRGPPSQPSSGGSDDIGDVSWVVPTVTLNYPSNVPGLAGHHWSSAMTMATPIAHKGVVAGARVLARAGLELFVRPSVVAEARQYFQEVSLADGSYVSYIGEEEPATHLNVEIMAQFRDQLRPYYYDETRYDTYLEQLGIEYPTLRPDQWEAVRAASPE